jgi:DNA adenine methylase
MAKPFVKWAGGKSRLVRELLSRIPGEVRTYAEPFAGGGALFFALQESVAKGERRVRHAVLGDRNDELMATYRALKHDVGAVIAALAGYRYDRELYYDVRARDVRGESDVERAARFLFLNRTCFNGLWRVNAEGKFNVPFGRYKNPRIVDEPNLRAASEALAKADLVTDDYQAVTRKLGAGDFVYFDPPYMPLTKTATFTDYVPGGFAYAEHERLARELRSLKKRGVLAMLSNADTASTRDIFGGFAVTRVYAPRSINSDGDKRGDAAEILVTNWGPAGFTEVEAEVAPVTRLQPKPAAKSVPARVSRPRARASQ